MPPSLFLLFTMLFSKRAQRETDRVQRYGSLHSALNRSAVDRSAPSCTLPGEPSYVRKFDIFKRHMRSVSSPYTASNIEDAAVLSTD